MKKQLQLILLLLLVGSLSAQIQYKEINAQKLGEKRQLKIQLPRNYDQNPERHYPVILVFDGDYLFEPVAGNVDLFSYWEDMPDALVVGINQSTSREDDSFYDDTNFVPSETGAAFFEFVGMELFPWLQENYRINNFNIVIGHDITANLANYYLMKEPPLFQGYISLSPDMAPLMEERLPDALQRVNEKIFYYQATASNDIEPLRKGVLAMDQRIKSIDNPNLKYYFDDFEDASHYSLTARAIPKALEQIFTIYRPISKKEYTDVILKLDTPAYDYLVDKYATINEMFGLDLTIRVNDFIATAAAIEKKEDWESLAELGKLARKEYPETMLGNYYIARSQEMDGRPKKALKTYENAFVLREIGNVSKDLVLNKANQIKKDFGL
tara:strand:- start:405 stop:1553 length:1149 start_codon:yes stop_codon:yes gene_type:complete